MFIGHYGLGFMVKKRFREVPLWLPFLSVQLMDLVAFVMVLLGIEKAAYRSSDNPFLTNALDLPYSHSLVGALVLSALMYVVLIALKRRSWALIAALCVLSHWIIDVMVHTPDLSVFPGHMKVGLGLWNYPYLSFAIEVVLVLVGWLILGNRNVVSFVLLFLLLAGFTGMTFGEEPDMVRTNSVLRISMVLVPTALFVVLAYFSEKAGKGKKD